MYSWMKYPEIFLYFRYLLVSWLNFLSRKFKQDSADPTDVLGFFQYLVHVLCVQPLRNSKSYLLCASQGLWPSHYRRRTQTLSSQLVEMTREPVPSALHTGLLEGTESFPQKESSILRFFSQEELEAGGPARFQQDLKDWFLSALGNCF